MNQLTKSIFFFIFSVFIFCSIITCNNRIKNDSPYISDSISFQAKKNNLVDSENDNYIINEIYKLPEIKEYEQRLDSLNNPYDTLVLRIYSRPDPTHSYYCVQAGVMHPGMFVAEFSFYYYVKSGEIKYLDTLRDTVISLDGEKNSFWK